ncbi:MAG: GNAT family N-acetyltransferase [Oscillospiraceae bacterium]|nr:GNAT family N-acetyltransferase [Oscillospiraceae bacterium]
MELTIRQAMPKDAAIFTDCLILCWQSAYKGIVPDDYLNNMVLDREKRIERYKHVFSNPGDCVYYCVTHEDRMVGFLVINKNRNSDTPDIGEIWAIYLIEDFCGKGHGIELLDFEINELKRSGCKQIYLWVFEDIKRARRFYEKHGFRFDGKIREMTYGKPLIHCEYVLERCQNSLFARAPRW